MADPLAFLVRGRPITAEVLRDYGNVLLRAADQMAKGQLTVSEASVIIEKTAPCEAGVIEMVLMLHEPRTLN